MKYRMKVDLISRRQKEITVYAQTEEEAEDKALEIVLRWDGVEDAEVTDIEEDR